MSELANKLTVTENPHWDEVENDPKNKEVIINLEGGVYRDPDPNIVNWINQKFTDTQENIEAHIIKAFEFAGIIRPLKETLKPLEHTGLIPKGKTSEFVNCTDNSLFIERREEQLLDEFISDDLVRNKLLNDIKRLTVERFSYDRQDVEKLWSYGKEATKSAREIPSVLRELTVMLGIRPPENIANTPSIPPPPITRELAPDIYLMMHRESKSKY